MRLRAAEGGALALGLLAGLAPAAGTAQSYACRLPDRVAVPRVRPDGPVRRLPVTGYTLALSWSPEYCRAHGNGPTAARQCNGREGQFGLIVHGLWPEGGEQWPQWCAARPTPAAALRANMCLTPSADLLAHEWAKHGTCMTRRAETYFKVTRILYEGLRLPDLDRHSREENLTAGFLRERFAEANPGWSGAAIGVHTNKRGWLTEIRLCYDRRFMPEPCDPKRRGASDATRVRIWRGL